jgi:hypothetical protein
MMFVNQPNASKMAEDIVRMNKMAAEKKKKKKKKMAARAAAPIKTLTAPPPKVIVATKKALGADETVAEAAVPPANDADVSSGCTDEITERTGMTGSTRGIDATDNSTRILDYNMIMAVVGSWGKVKAQDDYEEALGEQIILKMMELEPCTRDMLGLTPLRSPHFTSTPVSINMVGMIDVIVSFIGPDMEHSYDDLLDLGKLYISEGFNAELFPFLSQSVCSSLKFVLAEDFSPAIEDAWNTVIDFMATKMSLAYSL